MRLITKIFGTTMALIAFSMSAHAQTVVFNGIGSSALFLQLGLAAGTATSASPAGVGATCVWSQKSSSAGALRVTDPTNSQTETGNAWIAWTGSCTTITSSTLIYANLQTDSVIGDRCFFNKCTLGAASSPAGTTSDGLIFGTSGEVTLPSAVWNALSGKAITVAATDIRPEDAKFATLRALTGCNTPLATGSQYLGLGYTSGGSPITSYYSNSTFHVTDFTLPVDGSYTVLPIGAVPIVVAINPSGSGFGTGVSNISHSDLAKFLSGAYGNTIDLSGAASAGAATVLIREPLSGTYNTMEYSVPNTTSNSLGNGFDLQTSQDVGYTQASAQKNCDGSVPRTATNTLGTSGYVMHVASADNASAYRNRAIGTGQELSTLFATADSLGYAFWSTANFASATSTNAKYLTVDGVDPLMNSYSSSNGVIPTSTTALSNVTFSHLQDGTYPIWSLLRLVASSSDTYLSRIKKLGSAAQGFSLAARPDFVPFAYNSSSSIAPLKVFHSHFAPTGVNFYSTGTNLAANGTSAFSISTGNTSAAPSCTDAEAGGDVGGAIGGVASVLGDLSQSDAAYCANGNPTGQTGYRK